jgi:hypothetical protein
MALAAQYLRERAMTRKAPGCVLLAVVGAHLQDQPLNHQLTDRGAHLVKTCRTSGDYRLYALGTKPGLIRDAEFNGWGIEVEVWAIPENRFGSFVAAVPSPLAIGNVRLEDGSCVKGFICEPAGVLNAEEITRFGGWRNYLNGASRRSRPSSLAEDPDARTTETGRMRATLQASNSNRALVRSRTEKTALATPVS